MHAAEVKQMIEQQVANTQVEVDGEGCNFQLFVISDEVAALSPVKRQQAIYAVLNDAITDGRIHAVTMKFFTRQAWASRA